MKHILAPILAACLIATPVLSQEAETDEGFDLMEEGTRLIMRGLMSEMQPALDELEARIEEWEPTMRAFVSEMGPALRDVAEAIDDIRNYDAPEILDNGDIIIRRSEDAPPYEPSEDVTPEIDL